MPFTYNIQLSSHQFNQSDDKGTISKQEAVNLSLPKDVNNKEEAIILIKDFFDGKIPVKENKGLLASLVKLFK